MSRRSTHKGRLVILLLVVLNLSACTVWRVQDAPPGEVLSEPRARVRVTKTSGEKVELKSASMVGDSLVSFTSKDTPEMTALPIDDIRAVELKKVSWIRTVPLLVGGVYLAAGILVAVNGLF